MLASGSAPLTGPPLCVCGIMLARTDPALVMPTRSLASSTWHSHWQILRLCRHTPPPPLLSFVYVYMIHLGKMTSSRISTQSLQPAIRQAACLQAHAAAL